MPSVSTILGETLFKRKYSGVNPEILNAAALWGNQVHVAIEDKNPMLLNETQEQRYNEFWQIIEEEVRHHKPRRDSVLRTQWQSSLHWAV